MAQKLSLSDENYHVPCHNSHSTAKKPQWRGVPAQLLSRFEAVTDLHLAIDLDTAPTVGSDAQPSWKKL